MVSDCQRLSAIVSDGDVFGEIDEIVVLRVDSDVSAGSAGNVRFSLVRI